MSYVQGMFQTAIHHWLQSFNAPAIEYLMRAISVLGEEQFLAFLVLAIIFGVDRTRGFLLAQTLLWTAILTSALKDLIALPRPIDVDALVRDVTHERNVPTPFTGAGAPGFFASLPADVIAYFRGATAHISYGFPSGHCSTTLAVSGSATVLWHRRWLLVTTCAISVLMPLSRMYLGRHFLADTLGGLVIGLCAVLILALVMREARDLRTGTTPAIVRALVRFVLPMGFVLFLPGAPANEAAMLLGINIGQAWSARMLPPDRLPGTSRKIIAVGAAALAFLAIAIAIRLLVKPITGVEGMVLGLLGRVVTPCGAILVGSFATLKILPRNQLNTNNITR